MFLVELQELGFRLVQSADKHMHLKKIIEKNQEDLEKINNQRRLWLWASSVTFVALMFIIFAWDWIDHIGSKSVWWLVIGCMIIVSVNWWYWTLRVIRKLIMHQEIEYYILESILDDIKHVKQHIKELGSQHLDEFK